MNDRPNEKQMVKAVHILMKDDKEYKKDFIKDMTYREFIKECPEFLEDM